MYLEPNTWYWVSHPHEADIFIPVYSRGDGTHLRDGCFRPNNELSDLIVQKATMPEVCQ